MNPPKKYTRSLFVFRRDLRFEDNFALIAALEQSMEVLPAFIFDTRQIRKNEYFSAPGFRFMLQSLEELNASLKKQLVFLEGQAHEVISEIINKENIKAVFVNKDYTPFSVQRDQLIAEVCRKKGADYVALDDAVLHHPDAVFKNNGGVYTVFTPYFRKASQLIVDEPRKDLFHNYATAHSLAAITRKLSDFSISSQVQGPVKGGRAAALAILKDLKLQKHYTQTRDIPSLDSTTHLSAHLKFGTCSVREAYFAVRKSLGPEHPLIRQLHWRDFFVQVGYHHPYVLGRSFNEKYDRIEWENDEKKLSLWCKGETGFPIVDAGMRELNQTGFMHNRCRMITASFLVKDLHIDWRKGEKYFSQKLVDYDPLVNNGNWQWAASTGCDAQPYFRIFNPWLQQEKFDPGCLYIKKWVPELKNLSPKQIHRLGAEPLLRPQNYPPLIVDHRAASEKAKKLFRAC